MHRTMSNPEPPIPSAPIPSAPIAPAVPSQAQTPAHSQGYAQAHTPTSSSEPAVVPSPATPWRRLMGSVYEAVILFGVLWFADYAFSALTQFRGEPGPLRTAFQVFTTGVLGGYFVFFWSAGRYSLPMKTMSLGVVDRNGAPLSAPRAAVRFAAALALPVAALAAGKFINPWLYLLLPANWIWCLFDKDHQALHDRIAGTRLVYLPFVRRARSVDV
jgi:uncharacterized RDD family membrane protein YckC